MLRVAAPQRPVGIRGVGLYVPTRRLDNHQLQPLGCPVSPDWIARKTGVRQRFVADDSQAMSDLAAPAASAALIDAGLRGERVDALIVAGDNHDSGGVRLTSGSVATLMGLQGTACLDLRVGCPGSVVALHVGAGMVAGGIANCALVAAAEVNTRGMDWRDRSSVWFGDAAAAAVLEPCRPSTGILATAVAGDGHDADILEVPAGGSREPTTAATVAAGRHQLLMNGRAVFPFAVDKMVECVRAVTAFADVDLTDLKAIVPHQANLRIIQQAMTNLGLPMERAVVNIERVGNTGSPAALLAFAEAHSNQLLVPGDLAVVVGFGGGLAWGAQLVRINEKADFEAAHGGCHA